jgi:hypothetical protein
MSEDDFRRIEQMMANQLARQFGVMEENMQHRFDLLAEGQQALAERMDRMETELRGDIRKVDARVTGVAADLAAHRADTEAHRRGYQVRE